MPDREQEGDDHARGRADQKATDAQNRPVSAAIRMPVRSVFTEVSLQDGCLMYGVRHGASRTE